MAKPGNAVGVAQSEPSGQPPGSPSRRRRVVRAALSIGVLLVVAFTGAVVADLVTPAEFRLGPHRAELRLTLRREEVIDLGPVGSLSKPAHFGGVGFRITVKEIPRSDADGRAALSLEDYVHLYTDQAQIRANARRAILRHSVRGALVAVLMSLFGFLALHALLGARRRDELAQLACAHRTPIAIGVATVLVVAVVAYVVHVSRPVDERRVSEILRDTPLAGASVRGELLTVLIDEYGPRVTEFVRQNDEFYDAVSTNLRRAYRQSVVLTAGSETQSFMFSAGLHCNIGMAGIIGRVVDRWDPSFVITGGDDALGASAIDATCINSFAYHVRGTPVVAAPGDHDTAAAEAAMRKHGFTVLDGEPVEESGVTVLGDDDPRVAVVAGGLIPRRDETVTEMGRRLAEVACAKSQGVDILVANEPGAVRDTARRGCARLVLAGSEAGQVLRVTTGARTVGVAFGGSAGGAAPNTLTVGPLQAPAELLIVELNKATHQPLRYQRIHFGTDASVTVAPPALFSAAPVGTVP